MGRSSSTPACPRCAAPGRRSGARDSTSGCRSTAACRRRRSGGAPRREPTSSWPARRSTAPTTPPPRSPASASWPRRMLVIYHIALESDWDAALEAGEYRTSTLGRTLEDEGFLHASTASQVRDVADAHLRRRPGTARAPDDRRAAPDRPAAVGRRARLGRAASRTCTARSTWGPSSSPRRCCGTGRAAWSCPTCPESPWRPPPTGARLVRWQTSSSTRGPAARSA